jgi:circadian clock protein KaiB
MKRRPTPARKRSVRKTAPNARPWHFRLYLAGQTPRSLNALLNLRRLCEAHLAGRHRIEIIDLTRSPGLGNADQIIALPTLVRLWPQPVKRLIGDLSDTARVLASIDLPPTPLPS